MKGICLLLFCWLSTFSVISAQTESIPFDIELEEITFNDWTGLHSFAFAEWNGYWFFVAGRSNGLHGFFPFTGFPESSANHQIWMMDVASGNYWQQDIRSLPNPIAEALQASNPQYVQKDGFLYVVGGYGKSKDTDSFVTFPYLTALNLEMLTNLMLAEQSVLPAIQQLEDERMRVCGGEMLALGERFYLFGGHDFAGLYSQTGLPTFTQMYTNEVRVFAVEHADVGLQISNYEALQDTENYHRRDGSFAPLIQANGDAALGYYGGVFRYDKDIPFFNPVYINGDGVEMDPTYEQQMSHYTCPILPVFDAATGNMFSTFFGGLSFHYFDREKDKMVTDSLVPFIDDITTLIHFADGHSTEVVLPLEFDDLLGTNAKFILDQAAPHYDNKVIRLEEIEGRTRVGYIFGGIKALFANITPSSASNRLFEVYLTPKIVDAIDKETAANWHTHVYPNPFEGNINIEIEGIADVQHLALKDIRGQKLFEENGPILTSMIDFLEKRLKELTAGVYLLQLQRKTGTEIHKIVKM
ncbi:MAG: T9SS type A sorting domain-containing protein [Chitinophagales bacterium]